jgi:hypothetical protein
MPQVIRLFLLIETATFILAAAIHSGALVPGYEHREARIAETAIAAVLAGSLVIAWLAPRWTRRAGLVAQAFALFWTLVGIGTIVAGIGPRTALDFAYHAAIVIVLLWGLMVAWRTRVAVT